MPKKKIEKKNIKTKFTEIFELPKEIVLNMPLVTITGNNEMLIENYKGVIEYQDKRIRINTTLGIMKIEGNDLEIKQITKEDLSIYGRITKFEYLL